MASLKRSIKRQSKRRRDVGENRITRCFGQSLGHLVNLGLVEEKHTKSGTVKGYRLTPNGMGKYRLGRKANRK